MWLSDFPGGARVVRDNGDMHEAHRQPAQAKVRYNTSDMKHLLRVR